MPISHSPRYVACSRFPVEKAKFITDVCSFSFFQTRKRSLEEIQAIFGDAVEGVSVDDVPEHAAPQETSDEDKDEKITVDLSNNKLG